MPENPLWRRIRSSDITAFTQLYTDYYQFLFASGFRQCGDKEVTKDCLHDMFLEIWNSRESLPEVEHAGSYLKTFLHRKILRAIPKEHNLSDVGSTEEIVNSYEHLLVQHQADAAVKEKLQQAIKHLTRSQMTIIRMKFFEGKSYEEIAAINNTTTRTIYNQVYQALKILRKLVSYILL